MNQIKLNELKLKAFTEQDVLDYCLLNNINPDNIIILDLSKNELTDISGIKLFKNTEELYLDYNKLTDISVLNNLKNLKTLCIGKNQIKDILIIKNLKFLEFLKLNNGELTDISVLKDLNKLENLYIGNNDIKDIFILQYLKNLKRLSITDLELESDQIQYIELLKNLDMLLCKNGFKDMSVLNNLNKNIRIIK